MTNRRFEPDFRASFPKMVAGLIGQYMETLSPVEMADALDRQANRLRHEAEDPPTRFTIERIDGFNLDFAVYDSTGEEYLFEDYPDAAEFIRERLEGDD